MCEILLRIKDRAGFDPVNNALSTRPGDVIVAVPDGWNWTQAELTNPEWLVVKIPGVSVDSVLQLCALAFARNPDGSEGQLLWKRAKNCDVSDVTWKNLSKQTSPVTITQNQWNSILSKIQTKAGVVVIG